MRILRPLSALSAGLLSLTIAGAAIAATPGFTLRSGRFTAPGVAPAQHAPSALLEQAAPAVALAEMGAPVELGPAYTVELARGERVVKAPQVHMGLPVAMRGIAVTFDGDDVATLVSTALEDDLPASVTPAIGAGKAALAAQARTGLAHDPARAILVVWPTADGARLAWAIDVAPIQGVPYQPVTVVDAQTGEIVITYNAIVELDKAKVYPTNPVKSPAPADVTLPVGLAKSVLVNNLVVSQNCIDKKTVKSVTVMGFPLNVHVCDLLQTAAPDANGDYLDAPGMDTDPEDTFSEISMFYHANRAYDFFQGFNPKLDVNPGGPLPTISNLRIPQGLTSFDLTKISDPNLPLDPFQNAFFSPADPLFMTVFPSITGGAMWFGQGPKKDYSYDGDVVYHEFTHSVVNVTLKLAGSPHMDEFGASYSPGAMNEGLADFFSSAIAGDPDVGEYAVQDFASGLTAIRSLTQGDKCPSEIGGEVHQDSVMFSASLWDVRKALDPVAQGDFDGAVFTAMNKSATGDLGYEQLASLILEAVKASSLGQATADKLTAAFTARGLLPHCNRVLEYANAPLNGPKDLGGIWFAPGTQTTGVKSKTGWTPGVVQVHDKLPDGTGKLTIDITEDMVGGGGVLGGGGTPFKPVFLVRFAKDPIQFTYKPLAAQADMQEVAPKPSGKGYAAEVDVPAGMADVYVMVANSGQSDGGLHAFTLTATPGAGTTSSTGAGVGGGAAESSSSSSTGTGTGGSSPIDDGSGCGCAIPGAGEKSTGAAIAALAALGLAASRRRRRG
jgi:MYXO-CTERM domain-containing protein